MLASYPVWPDLKRIVIAIDGPAASGKSTTARLVAQKLGYTYVDTGAMYRALTLKALRLGIDLNSIRLVESLTAETQVRLFTNGGQMRLFLDGFDVTREIRRQEVTNAVSLVSSYPRVREAMVREQREMGRDGGVVLEGRDIGTVVFPDAELKIFMVANLSERARRRMAELKATGLETDQATLEREILERDEKDSERDISPLRRAADAIALDTSGLTIDQQVEFIVERAKEIIRKS